MRRLGRRDLLRTTLPLAVLAGVTLGFTPAPNEWAAPSYVGLAFLLFAVAPPGQRPSMRGAFIAGWVCSFLINAMALYWVFVPSESTARPPSRWKSSALRSRI